MKYGTEAVVTQIVDWCSTRHCSGSTTVHNGFPDIPSATSYEDDTKVSLVILNFEDAIHLQRHLFEIYKWAKNSIEFNVEKFRAPCYQQAKLDAVLNKYTGPAGIANLEIVSTRSNQT